MPGVRIQPTPQDQRTIQQMIRWIRNFKITGTGVTFSNTPEGCVCNITPASPRSWISKAPVQVAKITSAISGYTGKYGGAQLTGGPTDSATGALNMPDGMTLGASDKILICNVDEDAGTGVAASTHRLSIGTYVEGSYFGQTTESTPCPIFWTHGGVGEPSTGLITLPHGSYGSPNATTWSRNTDGKPVKFDPSWTGYDSTSGNLFTMIRTPIYDARGMLISVSAEVQTNITC